MSNQYDDFDLPKQNETIDPNEAGKLITEELINKVFTSDMVCREHVITSLTGQMVVPIDILDYKTNIPFFYAGKEGFQANAQFTYTSIVNLTYWLLKVGTYSYYEYRKRTGRSTSKDREWRSSGRALFTDEYTLSNIGERKLTPEPDDGGVLSTSIISVESIKQLAINCLNSWQSSNKPKYDKTYSYCHDKCHSNCHSNCHAEPPHANCHGNCHASQHDNCHGFSCHGNGPGYNNAGHGGYKSNS